MSEQALTAVRLLSCSYVCVCDRSSVTLLPSVVGTSYSPLTAGYVVRYERGG